MGGAETQQQQPAGRRGARLGRKQREERERAAKAQLARNKQRQREEREQAAKAKALLATAKEEVVRDSVMVAAKGADVAEAMAKVVTVRVELAAMAAWLEVE